MQIKNILLKNNCNCIKPELDTKKTIAIVSIGNQQIDYYLDYYKELYPQGFRAWHAKYIKEHGIDGWVTCAQTAKQEGRQPQKYFVWLLCRK